jgi:3-hydroxyisobutyrate dehydrogenase-like beta-hydroxyacid dehydrogenase
VCSELVENYGSQCNAAQSPKDIFEQAQTTFVCVADWNAVKVTICDGEREIIAADNKTIDKGLVMLSSISVETSRDINNALMMKDPVRYQEESGRRDPSDSGIASSSDGWLAYCHCCSR